MPARLVTTFGTGSPVGTCPWVVNPSSGKGSEEGENFLVSI